MKKFKLTLDYAQTHKEGSFHGSVYTPVIPWCGRWDSKDNMSEIRKSMHDSLDKLIDMITSK